MYFIFNRLDATMVYDFIWGNITDIYSRLLKVHIFLTMVVSRAKSQISEDRTTVLGYLGTDQQLLRRVRKVLGEY